MNIITSFCGLCLLLIIGKILRVKVRVFQKLYLPASVIGGLVGLILLNIKGIHIPDYWTAGWSRLPGILINVVFAALFLGLSIPPLRTIWRQAGPQLGYGQIVAWGQYVVGLGLVLLLLKPLFHVPELFGVVLPVGFEGGHGTAAGLRETFANLSWSEAASLCLTSATFGIVAAIIVGMALINWAVRKGYVHNLDKDQLSSSEIKAGLYPVDDRPKAGVQTTSPDSIDSLALHLAIIGVAILIGYGIKQVLISGEQYIPPLAQINFFKGFPLFPLCMIGGLIVQLFVSKFFKIVPIDHATMQRLAGTALDFLVVAAISTIQLSVVMNLLTPFLILMLGGVLWNVFCVMWLARRLLPDDWFERSIAEMGQSMGVTATGLLLLRVVDPEQKTNAPPAFGYKQLLHEPFMGGGLWTSSAALLVAYKGGWTVWLISIGACVCWLLVFKLLFLRKKRV